MNIIGPKLRSAGHGTGKNLGKEPIVIGFKIDACDHADQAYPKKWNSNREDQIFVLFYYVHAHGKILFVYTV